MVTTKEELMPTVRMPHPAALIPGVTEALAAADRAVAGAGLEGGLLALSRLRASQINGCGPQAPDVAAWRETARFSDEERAALALTEAVTRLADRPDPVPDEVWDLAAKHFDQRELAALLLAVALTNAVNRLDAATRQQA
jgi:alkylhydroperoxidase family enzyme